MAFVPHTSDDVAQMLARIGAASVGDLFADIPESQRKDAVLDLPGGLSELEVTQQFADWAGLNADSSKRPTFLGAGCYDHYVPSVVDQILSRSEFYTAYTPYQPEVSQGTLQVIYEFQTLICELLAMDIANASLYDGASALAEAAIMAVSGAKSHRILVSGGIHPGYRQVLATYTRWLGVELVEVPLRDGVTDLDAVREGCSDAAAILFQQPNYFGCIEPAAELVDIAHAAGALGVAAVNPLSLLILQPPGEYDADIAVAEGQPLGLGMNFGGPGLGIFACRESLARRMPGRICGRTTDTGGRTGYVLTLQTREQHIRREKATSNICTNQGLCALAATVYLSTLGPAGARQVADLCLQKAHYLADRLSSLNGYSLTFPAPFFHEFALRCPISPETVNARLEAVGLTGGRPLGLDDSALSDSLLIAVTEQRTRAEMDRFFDALA